LITSESIARLFLPAVRAAGLVIAVAACLAQAGCVQRRMTIRTNPPGAMVYVDEHPIGLSPISTNFTYYGTRQIRLVKDGYETRTIKQPVSPPWYEIPPLDFIAENFVPGEIRDQHVFDYPLTPQRLVPEDEVRGRAEELRRQTRSAAGVQPNGLAGTAPGAPYPGTAPGGLVAPSPGLLAPPAAPGLVTPPATPGPELAPGPAPVGPSPYPVMPPDGWRGKGQ